MAVDIKEPLKENVMSPEVNRKLAAAQKELYGATHKNKTDMEDIRFIPQEDEEDPVDHKMIEEAREKAASADGRTQATLEGYLAGYMHKTVKN